MKKVLMVLMVLAAVVALFGLFAAAIAEEMDPAAVVEAVYAAVEAGDIDAAVEMLAEDAVLTLLPPPGGMDGTFVGKEEIGAWFENLAAESGRFEFSDVKTDGNVATMKLVFHSDFFDNVVGGPAEFDGTAIVQDGLWKAVSWAFTPEFLAEMDAAMALQANQALADRFMNELWIEGNLDVADEILSEDFVSHVFPAGDKEALKAAVTGFHADFPQGTFLIHEKIVTPDRIVMRGSAATVPEGAAEGTEPEAFDEWIVVLNVENGQITERRIGFVPAGEPPGAAVTAEEILGVWRVLGVDFDFYHKFYDDGTFHAGDSPETLDDEPLAIGEYWFDAGNLVMKELEVVEIPPCGEEPVIYAAELLDSGNLKLTLVQDDCEPRIDSTAREHESVP